MSSDEPTQETSKPSVKLIGKDGNAFAIMNACTKAAYKAGMSKESIKEMLTEMTHSDYDHLLQVVLKYFDVE